MSQDEDGCDNTCNDLRLGVGLRHDGHHQHPHRHRVDDEGGTAHGTEFEYLNTVAVPEGFQAFGEGRFSSVRSYGAYLAEFYREKGAICDGGR